VLSLKFDKDAKNKVRTFYHIFFDVIKKFLEKYENEFETLGIKADEKFVFNRMEEFKKSKAYKEIVEERL
jgi:hypothetical protein